MNKFNKVLKWIAVGCTITFIIGITLSIVTFNKYHGKFSDFVQKNNSINIGTIGEVFGNGINNFTDALEFISDDADDYSNNSSKTLSKEIEISSIKNLDIDCDMSKIEIIEGTNTDKVKVSCKYLKKCEVKTNGDKTRIDISNSENRNNVKNINYKLELEVPKDFSFEDININSNMGNLKLRNIKFKNCNFDMDLGNVDIDNKEYILADNMIINLSMGNLQVNNMDAINSKLTNNMGNIEMKVNNSDGEKYKDLVVECDCGKILTSFDYLNRNITLNNSLGETIVNVKTNPNNIDFNIQCDAGKVTNNLKTYENCNLNDRYKVEIRNNLGNIRLEH